MKNIWIIYSLLAANIGFATEQVHEDLAVRSVKNYFQLTRVQTDIDALIELLSAEESAEALNVREAVTQSLLKSEEAVQRFTGFPELQFATASVNVAVASLKFGLLNLLRTHMQRVQSEPELRLLFQKISADLDSVVQVEEE